MKSILKHEQYIPKEKETAPEQKSFSRRHFPGHGSPVLHKYIPKAKAIQFGLAAHERPFINDEPKVAHVFQNACVHHFTTLPGFVSALCMGSLI